MVFSACKLLLLLRLFPSRVPGMILNINLPLCSVQYVIYCTRIHQSFHLVFCLPLSLSPVTGASTILLSSCPSSLLSIYSVIVLLLVLLFLILSHSCSFLMLSFFVTPYIHRSIPMSFTSCFFSWLLLFLAAYILLFCYQ